MLIVPDILERSLHSVRQCRFHSSLESSAAVCLRREEWNTIQPRLESAPTFVYPLLRSRDQGAHSDGAFVTMFTQFQAPTHVLLTPLAEWQQHGSNAKPCIIVTIYTELASAKGIVLARVDIINQALLDKASAEELIKALAEMYLQDDRFALVRTFTKEPRNFSFDDVLAIAKEAT